MSAIRSRLSWRRTAEAAADAVDRITVDYEVLPTSSTRRRPPEEGAPQLHENAPNNIVMHWTCGKGADEVRAAIDQAEIKLSQRIVNQRLIPNAMETRGSIGRYDPGTGEYTLWATSQAPHVMRLLITAFVMGSRSRKSGYLAGHGRRFRGKIFLYFDMC